MSGGKAGLVIALLGVLAVAGVFIGIKFTQGGDDEPSVARPVATSTTTYSKPSMPVATTSEPTSWPRQPQRVRQPERRQVQHVHGQSGQGELTPTVEVGNGW
jgi:hypothetical protein